MPRTAPDPEVAALAACSKALAALEDPHAASRVLDFLQARRGDGMYQRASDDLFKAVKAAEAAGVKMPIEDALRNAAEPRTP